ncbi:MAG: hypothetical protein AUJ72_02785 [Candidatus Omnitrophica bacterium CG1_02_46_14]|nr:MAG: hypothetical protein AUJ72_02785 [Candidatus Omnitrophica bacterium CG1_02_46_14]
MRFFLSGLGLLGVSGFFLLFLGRFRKQCHGVFIVSLVVSMGLVFFSSLPFLYSNVHSDFYLPWRLPFGEFKVGLDPLSAFFLVTISCVALASGIYGVSYLNGHSEKKNLGVHYFFCHFFILSLFLAVTAKNVVLFFTAWELMSIFAYFLITFYDEKKSARQAGLLYLVVNHFGAFCVLTMFILMGHAAGSLDFDQMTLAHYSPALTGILIALALVGFGVKAGFFPVHFWLPHAHPAAPSHISALLSGLVLKMGIYGLLRVIFIIKDLPGWCGPVMLLIGVVSGVLGVLYALGQHEIKRLLAYHSIENLGIIALGIGIGLVGQAHHEETIALIGYAGALLHVFNHALFKSLLFLSAGSVIRSTGTGEMDEMGGLLKSLPFTGHLFLIGSLSICGLPLFNGFISEWLIYRAFFDGVIYLDKTGIMLAILSMVSLALIGGLAAACFAKAFGVIFLGQNRSHEPKVIKENPWMMWGPMAFLGLICVWVGLFPKTMVLFSLRSACFLIAARPEHIQIGVLLKPVLSITTVFGVFFLILISLILIRAFLAKRIPQRRAQTWACGYASMSPRMQTTASSFAEPILRFFKSVTFFRIHSIKSTNYFPENLELTSTVTDTPEHFIFRPFYAVLIKFSKWVLKLQNGHIPQYLLYILLAVVVLIFWKFPW